MAPWKRSLHITGAYSAQPATGADVTSIYRSRSLADLRTECEKRNLRTGGSKAEVSHAMLSPQDSIAVKLTDNGVS